SHAEPQPAQWQDGRDGTLPDPRQLYPAAQEREERHEGEAAALCGIRCVRRTWRSDDAETGIPGGLDGRDSPGAVVCQPDAARGRAAAVVERAPDRPVCDLDLVRIRKPRRDGTVLSKLSGNLRVQT